MTEKHSFRPSITQAISNHIVVGAPTKYPSMRSGNHLASLVESLEAMMAGILSSLPSADIVAKKKT